MEIVFGYPPNIKEIRKVFDIGNRKGIVFTYGNKLFNPSRGKIADHLLVHEMTHMAQQGEDPAKWWDKYLEDPIFRLGQEIEAYRNQYTFGMKKITDRNQKAVFLHRIASDLSGPIYGGIVDYKEAKELIINK